MRTLWYALFMGELCRLRKDAYERLVSEVWRNGSWVQGANFAEEDFKGRTLSENEALDWIRRHFREKHIRSGPGGSRRRCDR